MDRIETTEGLPGNFAIRAAKQQAGASSVTAEAIGSLSPLKLRSRFVKAIVKIIGVFGTDTSDFVFLSQLNKKIVNIFTFFS